MYYKITPCQQLSFCNVLNYYQDIKINWYLLSQLYVDLNEFPDVKTKASTFFKYVYKDMFDIIVLKLGVLLAKNNQSYSIHLFDDQLKDFKDQYSKEYKKNNKSIAKRILSVRNQYIAHFDMNSKKYDISFADLRKMIDYLDAMFVYLNKIFGDGDSSLIYFSPIGTADLHKIIEKLSSQ